MPLYKGGKSPLSGKKGSFLYPFYRAGGTKWFSKMPNNYIPGKGPCQDLNSDPFPLHVEVPGLMAGLLHTWGLSLMFSEP